MDDVNWIIYSIGDARYLASILDAIALVVDDSSFYSMVKIGFLMGGVLVVMQGLAGGRGPDFQKVVVSWLVFMFLFGNTTSVGVISKYNGDSHKIDNVPLGIAAAGSIISNVGLGITELMEQAFTSPAMTAQGFGGSVDVLKRVRLNSLGRAELGTANTVSGTNFAKSWMNYIAECTMRGGQLDPNFLDRVIKNPIGVASSGVTPLGLSWTHDLWGTEIYVSGSAPSALTCTAAYPALINYTQTTFLPAFKAEVLGPALNACVETLPGSVDCSSAAPLVTSRIETALQDLGITSVSADDFILSSVLQTLFLEGQELFQVRNAGMTYATAIDDAVAQRNVSWMAQGEMFRGNVRPMLTFIEGFTFAITPIVGFIVALGTFGVALAGKYAQLLMWIQLWMPMLAIVNLYLHNVVAGRLSELGLLSMTSIMGMGRADGILLKYVATAELMASMTPMLALVLVTGSSFALTRIAGAIGGEGTTFDPKRVERDTSSASPILAGQATLTASPTGGISVTGADGLLAGVNTGTAAQSMLGSATAQMRTAQESWQSALASAKQSNWTMEQTSGFMDTIRQGDTARWGTALQNSATTANSIADQMQRNYGIDSVSNTALTAGAEGEIGLSFFKNVGKKMAKELGEGEFADKVVSKLPGLDLKGGVNGGFAESDYEKIGAALQSVYQTAVQKTDSAGANYDEMLSNDHAKSGGEAYSITKAGSNSESLTKAATELHQAQESLTTASTYAKSIGAGHNIKASDLVEKLGQNPGALGAAIHSLEAAGAKGLSGKVQDFISGWNQNAPAGQRLETLLGGSDRALRYAQAMTLLGMNTHANEVLQPTRLDDDARGKALGILGENSIGPGAFAGPAEKLGGAPSALQSQVDRATKGGSGVSGEDHARVVTGVNQVRTPADTEGAYRTGKSNVDSKSQGQALPLLQEQLSRETAAGRDMLQSRNPLTQSIHALPNNAVRNMENIFGSLMQTGPQNAADFNRVSSQLREKTGLSEQGANYFAAKKLDATTIAHGDGYFKGQAAEAAITQSGLPDQYRQLLDVAASSAPGAAAAYIQQANKIEKAFQAVAGAQALQNAPTQPLVGGGSNDPGVQNAAAPGATGGNPPVVNIPPVSTVTSANSQSGSSGHGPVVQQPGALVLPTPGAGSGGAASPPAQQGVPSEQRAQAAVVPSGSPSVTSSGDGGASRRPGQELLDSPQPGVHSAPAGPSTGGGASAAEAGDGASRRPGQKLLDSPQPGVHSAPAGPSTGGGASAAEAGDGASRRSGQELLDSPQPGVHSAPAGPSTGGGASAAEAGDGASRRSGQELLDSPQPGVHSAPAGPSTGGGASAAEAGDGASRRPGQELLDSPQPGVHSAPAGPSTGGGANAAEAGDGASRRPGQELLDSPQPGVHSAPAGPSTGGGASAAEAGDGASRRSGQELLDSPQPGVHSAPAGPSTGGGASAAEAGDGASRRSGQELLDSPQPGVHSAPAGPSTGGGASAAEAGDGASRRSGQELLDSPQPGVHSAPAGPSTGGGASAAEAGDGASRRPGQELLDSPQPGVHSAPAGPSTGGGANAAEAGDGASRRPGQELLDSPQPGVHSAPAGPSTGGGANAAEAGDGASRRPGQELLDSPQPGVHSAPADLGAGRGANAAEAGDGASRRPGQELLDSPQPGVHSAPAGPSTGGGASAAEAGDGASRRSGQELLDSPQPGVHSAPAGPSTGGGANAAEAGDGASRRPGQELLDSPQPGVHSAPADLGAGRGANAAEAGDGASRRSGQELLDSPQPGVHSAPADLGAGRGANAAEAGDGASRRSGQELLDSPQPGVHSAPAGPSTGGGASAAEAGDGASRRPGQELLDSPQPGVHSAPAGPSTGGGASAAEAGDGASRRSGQELLDSPQSGVHSAPAGPSTGGGTNVDVAGVPSMDMDHRIHGQDLLESASPYNGGLTVEQPNAGGVWAGNNGDNFSEVDATGHHGHEVTASGTPMRYEASNRPAAQASASETLDRTDQSAGLGRTNQRGSDAGVKGGAVPTGANPLGTSSNGGSPSGSAVKPPLGAGQRVSG